MAVRVIHRDRESAAVSEFLTAASELPSAMVMTGEPGIGKTTVWLAAIEEAQVRGFHVLSARPGASEVVLTYAALADLLGKVDDNLLTELPEPQRIATERVMAREAVGPASNEHVVGAAMLTIMTRLEKRSPLLVAVDDLQWLDASSRAALMFAARRVRGRVGILGATRSEPGAPDAAGWLQMSRPDGVSRIGLRALSVGGLHLLISQRLGRSLSRPAIVRIHEVSGGNPFYALELARVSRDAGPRSRVRLPETLTTVVHDRLTGLDRSVREMLLTVAAAAVPTVDLVAEFFQTTAQVVVERLEPAEDRGVVAIDGNRIEFTHPLLATGVYGESTAAQRRAVHRRLAIVVSQPELRARHLALSMPTADESTLAALDAAADVLSTRGAPVVAAELTELAISLGGDTPIRRIQAAGHHFRAADMARAQRIVEPALVHLPTGLLRAIAINIIATVRVYDDSYADAARLLRSVLDDASANAAVHARTLLSLSMAEGMSGARDEALDRAVQAVERAEGCGDDTVLSGALSMWVTLKCMYGHGFDRVAMRRACAIERPGGDTPVPFRPSAVHALMLAWTGELADAESRMAIVRRECVERGAESDMIWIAGHTVLINIWLGRFTVAAEVAADTMERAEQLGGRNMIVIARLLRAMVDAYVGGESSRKEARDVIDQARQSGATYLAQWPTMTLGFIETSQGNHAESLNAVAPLLDTFDPRHGIEILTSAFIPDAVESLVAQGRCDEAEPLVAALEANGRTLDRPWMLAVGARGRSMLLAASGDVAAAEASAVAAMEEHDRLPMPFEKARTQLLLGQLQRRRRHKDAAAVTLSSAAQAFDEMGTGVWATRARAELERVGVGPRRDTTILTPSERRVADLVASGMSSRDVAAALFISQKTVEVNLTRTYRKLGIRSRAQLGSRLSALAGE